jgi:hypothetical protein
MNVEYQPQHQLEIIPEFDDESELNANEIELRDLTERTDKLAYGIFAGTSCLLLASMLPAYCDTCGFGATVLAVSGLGIVLTTLGMHGCSGP